jgi:hypothetical protein
MRFALDGDLVKAASNLAKHGVAFDYTMGAFLKPLSLSRLVEAAGASSLSLCILTPKMPVAVPPNPHQFGPPGRRALGNALCESRPDVR